MEFVKKIIGFASAISLVFCLNSCNIFSPNHYIETGNSSEISSITISDGTISDTIVDTNISEETEISNPFNYTMSIEKTIYPQNTKEIKVTVIGKEKGELRLSDSWGLFRIENNEKIYIGGYNQEIVIEIAPDHPDEVVVGTFTLNFEKLTNGVYKTLPSGEYELLHYSLLDTAESVLFTIQ